MIRHERKDTTDGDFLHAWTCEVCGRRSTWLFDRYASERTATAHRKQHEETK